MEALRRLCRALALACACATSLVLTACKEDLSRAVVAEVRESKAEPEAPVPPPAAAPRTSVGLGSGSDSMSAAELERVSMTWLEALRAGKIEELQRLTAFPFQLREPAAYPSCQPQDVSTAESLRNALACLLDDTVLRDELGGELGGPSAFAMGKAALPPWAKALNGQQPRNALPVRTVVPGVRVNFEFVIFVNTKGVTAVWKNAEYDPN